ncbi:MAG TPA: hypothetical protein VM656_02250 [Pyrinomonadaceae bacterium]|jgi:hypothetical protein|nr:hypothetical protein [Pyrinomonadaceae bacterium]
MSESNRPLLTVFLGSRLPSLLNGGVGGLTIDPDGPGPLFEVPLAGPLPEDLAFIL